MLLIPHSQGQLYQQVSCTANPLTDAHIAPAAPICKAAAGNGVVGTYCICIIVCVCAVCPSV